ncbi:TonB-dependent receptor [Flavivirga aquimarina]|uniref:TonB-dependent receptor n=1 Tax=Flavivirga aquimarina TaxID=2027862 RepID=A0ABT8W8P2_9FLAO|nr:TonB-dependent receptor [Flavivirga aquimarina]MDO5969429.1 TonB-dependent receptor [Flavivirga aquimarina]
MRTRFILLLLFLFSISSFAQNLKVSGTVTGSEDNMPLPGVNVIVKGTNRGVSTDFDGNYTIEVSAGEVIEFSYVGYNPKTITVSDQSTINIALETNIDALEEVVVVGYGSAKKLDLTGSIVKVEGDDVADKPNANPVASLQGRVSGLSVVNTGRLGEQPDIRIRGTSSRYSSTPLYVVDGIFTDSIDYINPNDIESMQVLKDASSLAIFGVRGANGVIIVTTKTGKLGLTVNLNTTIGFKQISDKPDLANAALFRELYDEQLANDGFPAFGFYDQFSGDTDWVDTISNNSGAFQTINASVQNTTEKNKIYFGLGYRDEEGLVKEEKMQRITLNLNNELKVNDNLKIGANVNIQKDKLPNGGGFTAALNATPIVDPIHSDTRSEYNGLYNQLPIEIGGAQIANPLLVAEVTKNKRLTERKRLVGNIFTELKFLKGFTFKATIYGDFNNYSRRSYTPIIDIYTAETDEIVELNGNQITRVDQQTVSTINFQQDYILTYDKEINNHKFNLTAGFTTTETKIEQLSGSVEHDPSVGLIPDDERFWYVGVFPYGDPETRIADSNQFDRATSSFLGRLLYSYDEKYLLNASYRRDATSQLAPDNRAQDFWSLGGAWIVTNENFMDNFNALNFLKIKGSIGQLGNQFVPVSYPYYPGVDEGATAIFGGDVVPGYIQRFEENPDLKWETVKSWEVGFESTWLDNRLNFNATYYNKDTEDLLVFIDTGTAEFFDNAGEINNKGFEFDVSWNDEISENFKYSIGGNITTTKNEVISVYEDGFRIFDGPSVTEAGLPIGYFYGYEVEGIYQTYADIAEHEPVSDDLGAFDVGDFKYRDVNGDGEITADDRTMIGNPTPDFTYGIFTNVEYKNFFLNMDFQGVYGNEIFRNWGNGSSFAQFNFRGAREGRWTGQGTSNFEPRLSNISGYNRLNSSYMIEDGSYFRIRNIQLGYNFKPSSIKGVEFKQMKLYVNLQNVYTWSHNSGFTPEAGGSPTQFGVDAGGYPLPIISTLGFSLTF